MAAASLQNQQKGEARWAFAFLSPWLFGFLVFTLGPMVASLWFSMTRFSGLDTPVFIGLDNYTHLLTQDPKFWRSLGITFFYAFIAVPLNLALGFMLAWLLNLKIPLMSFWRTVYYLPSVISGVVVAILWRGLFDEKYGIVNFVLSWFGVHGPAWLLDSNFAILALILISVWGVGGGMIIYLAGLQSIQTSLYEAAELDGANAWERLKRITLPMMSPVIFYNLIIGIIACFQYFTEPWILTRGGPDDATLFYNISLYKNAFQYGAMGYASAMAWVLFLIVLVLTALVFRSSSMWVYYEGEVKK